MDRHVIANMGAELGATTSVFPSDGAVRHFLDGEGRGADWIEILADEKASYDQHDEIDLSKLEPLIARPSSPGNVVTVREAAGEPIYQSYIGSSANPGWRDFAVVAEIVRGKVVPATVSLDVNPSSRDTLERLAAGGHLGALIAAGARLHQTGCNGCIGMGQAPGTGQNSVRTVPRNFPGRSGTKEDRVWLCSPETAAASALAGKITDPRTLEQSYPKLGPAPAGRLAPSMLQDFVLAEAAHEVELIKGPSIKSLPEFDAMPDELELPVLLKLADDVSTDEILPAGARVLPHRSNIQKIAEFCFEPIDSSYVARTQDAANSGHAVIGGRNYGQGSSREHAAIAPRSLGLRIVLVESFARIHRQNLINYGVLPLTFDEPDDYDRLNQGDVLIARDLHHALERGETISLDVRGSNSAGITTHHGLTSRQAAIILAGGLINWRRQDLE
jgi:aconitate hydratase